jgi:hypothetical protein
MDYLLLLISTGVTALLAAQLNNRQALALDSAETHKTNFLSTVEEEHY